MENYKNSPVIIGERVRLLDGQLINYSPQNTSNELKYFPAVDKAGSDFVLLEPKRDELQARKSLSEAQKLILNYIKTLTTQEGKDDFINNLLNVIVNYKDGIKVFFHGHPYDDINIQLAIINKNAPNLMSKLKKWVNVIKIGVPTNLSHDYRLVQFKVSFFNKLDALAISSSYKVQATNIITAITANTVDILMTSMPHNNEGRDSLSIDKEFNVQLKKIVGESPEYREEILTWLFVIKNSNDGGMYFAIAIKAFSQVQIYINAKMNDLVSHTDKNDRDTFIKVVINNINSYRGLSAKENKVEYSEINGKLDQINLYSPHLLVELELWIMLTYYNETYTVIKPDTIPEQVKYQEQNHKNFAQAKNWIYNLYHDDLFCPAFIDIIFEIVGDIQNRADTITRLTGIVQDDVGAKRKIDRIKIEGNADYIMGKEKNSRKRCNNHNPTVRQELNGIIDMLSKISPAQRSKLKIWVENDLKDGKPEKTTDIAKIISFFQNHLLQVIIHFSNATAAGAPKNILDKITLSEIGELQAFKPGRAGSPDEMITPELHNTFKELTRIFNIDSFQRLVKRMLKTIYAVIDSEQYMANTGKSNSYLNPDHTKIDMSVDNDYDEFLYRALTRNIEVMASIRNICHYPKGFLQGISSFIGNTFGANYSTDEVCIAKEHLSSMINKEFYGAGYNALAVVSTSPQYYHKAYSNNMEYPAENDTTISSGSETAILTGSSSWNTTPTQQRKYPYAENNGSSDENDGVDAEVVQQNRCVHEINVDFLRDD